MIVQTAAVVSLAVLAAGAMALATSPVERVTIRGDRLAVARADAPRAATIERRGAAASTLIREPPSIAIGPDAAEPAPSPAALRD